MTIIDATEAHLPGILAIYNDAVAHTTAIWNEVLVDLENRRSWWQARIGQGYPVLVAVEGEEVLGYASFGDWRAFDGYKYTVEHSVYVAEAARGRSIGFQLMEVLIERARALNKHVLVAGIEAGNEASIRLHERLGFERVGLMPEVGTKFGRWLDLAFMQLILTPG